AGRRDQSGRKPKGEFSKLTSSLTIRIPDDMRDQLEHEADTRNQNITQVLLWHLRQSFKREYEKEHNPAIRALCFLITKLAHDVVGLHHGKRPIFSWRSDPFFFRAFKIAVAKLLDALEPEGKIRPPKLPKPFDDIFKDRAKKETQGSLQWRF